MELTPTEIKKISREFRIPEAAIQKLLADEERLQKITAMKNEFLQAQTTNKQARLLTGWIDLCLTFSEFEEIYMASDYERLDFSFFEKWIKASSNYKEKREVYNCLATNEEKTSLAKIWLVGASAIEDVREAMSYLDKNSDEYRLGIKKIMKSY